MEVEVTQENLAKALSSISRVASTRTAGMPILGNILFRTDGKQLLMAATNLEIAASQKIGAKVTTQGSVTVPARLVSELVAALPKGTLTLSAKGDVMQVKSEHTSSTVRGASDEEFPELPTIDEKEAVTYTFNALDFKTAAAQTIITASSDSTRPVLTGIYWHTFEGNLYFAATDGYRLSEKKIMPAQTEIAAIVPTTTMQEVLRSIAEDTAEIEVLFDDTQVRFRFGDSELISRLIDGNFPDYRQLIPATSETNCGIPSDELRRVVKLSGLFAREVGGSVSLELNTDTGVLTIQSVASELGENTSELQVAATGAGGAITLNSRYIADALSVIDDKQIMFAFSGKLAPSVVRPSSDDAYTHIIMPIKS